MKKILLSFSLVFALLAPLVALADTATTTTKKNNPLVVEPTGQTCTTAPDGTKKDCFASYTIDDFFRQFLVLAWWGLGLMSILAVGMLIWAGVLFITAAGNSGRIDEGKKIISGTITGIIISLLAFVIVNTVIGGLTGTKLRVTDYFQGTIATIFSSDSGKKQGVERPFAGLGTVDTNGSCKGSNNTEWDKTCAADKLHIFCADPNGGNDTIKNYQLALNTFNCNCGGADGCYGSRTFACVRNFQIQNRIAPTGELDAATRLLLDSSAQTTSTLKSCTASFIDPIAKKLPAIQSSRPSSGASENRGCCMVADTSGSSYCVDNVTEITCSSSGDASVFDANDKNCATSRTLRNSCGFCSNVAPGGASQFTTNYGYQYATERWCKNIASPALSFTAGTCIGRGGLLSCKSALLLTPEPVN